MIKHPVPESTTSKLNTFRVNAKTVEGVYLEALTEIDDLRAALTKATVFIEDMIPTMPNTRLARYIVNEARILLGDRPA